MRFSNPDESGRVGRKPHTTRFFVVPIRGEGESGLLQNDNRAIFGVIPHNFSKLAQAAQGFYLILLTNVYPTEGSF